MLNQNDNNRVLSHMGARELTAEEIARINGGSCFITISHFPGGRDEALDCTHG
jgi:hypothetical protein